MDKQINTINDDRAHITSSNEGGIDDQYVATGKPKSVWATALPTFACGSGLFSDGYVQSVIGSVNTILGQIYGKAFTNSPQRANVNAIAFVGTVVGQLVFGVLSDRWSRKNSLLISTIILIVFSALSAGAYGAGGTLGGMLAALTAYRFLVGIGVGGEYPAGSVGAAENSNELKRGTRNRWFIFSTNFAIDMGFVAGTLVPMICVLIFTEKHLRAAWRVSLGLAVIPPLSLLYLRFKMNEPDNYNRNKMNKYPYGLVIKFYWFRLLAVSLIWFLYDFSAYSFSIYSTSWLDIILGDTYPLWVSLGWGTLINAFYIPGAFIGAFFSDWVGPKYALVTGVTLQAVVGFIMTGLYARLDTPSHVAGFVVVYGIFLALGEVGPGDNIGLIASKTCATAIRGQYYGIAAAVGKIGKSSQKHVLVSLYSSRDNVSIHCKFPRLTNSSGAFIGTYVFPHIVAAGGDNVIKQGQYPFYVSCSLCLLSAIVTLTCIPNIGQDTIEEEDVKFREYLELNGYDTSKLGTKQFHEAVDSSYPTAHGKEY